MTVLKNSAGKVLSYHHLLVSTRQLFFIVKRNINVNMRPSKYLTWNGVQVLICSGHMNTWTLLCIPWGQRVFLTRAEYLSSTYTWSSILYLSLPIISCLKYKRWDISFGEHEIFSFYRYLEGFRYLIMNFRTKKLLEFNALKVSQCCKLPVVIYSACVTIDFVLLYSEGPDTFPWF